MESMRPDTQQWWEQAQADLRTSSALLAIGEFFAVSFHAHEAVEKALKALYIEISRVEVSSRRASTT